MIYPRSRILFLFICILANLPAFGTHIIGGQMSYECLGNDMFQMTLKVYRDCQSGGALFDSAPGAGSIATVTVYRGDDVDPYIETLELGPPLITGVDNNPDNPCIEVPPVVCVGEGVYIFQLELEASPESYHVTYQRCCRNPTVSNIINADNFGSTFTIEITNTAQVTCNNSPVFNNFPPPVICVNEVFLFDHAASDVEGDQLVYSFCNPLNGGGQGGGGFNTPAPRIDAPPPYSTVPFALPLFSVENPLGPNSPLSIDPNTGELSGFPTELGQYVVGICVSEFRNGELLSTSLRDFQFNVIVCENLVSAELGGSSNNGLNQEFIYNLCDEYQIDFENNSGRLEFIESYQWEFDTGLDGPLSYNQKDITVEFPGPGNYKGLMITNPGLECIDTARIVVNITPEINTDFEAVYDTCVAGPVDFTNFSSSGAINDYLWNFDDSIFSQEENPTHQYETAGNYNVELTLVDSIGCRDSASYEVVWFPVPPLILIDPSNVVGCPPVDVFLENLSVPVDSTYEIVWDFGDGNKGEGVSPTHIYTEAGLFTVGIQITSPIGCFTEDTFEDLIEIDSQVVAEFSFGPDSITSLQPVVHFFNHSTNDVNWKWWIEGFQYEDQMENPTVVFPDTGEFIVQLVAGHFWGCTDTTYQIVDVRPEFRYFMPNAFSPNGDGQNEAFGPVGIFLGLDNYQFSILNRWGELVFQSNDPQEKWNGQRFNNGRISQKGVYSYRVTYKEPRGKLAEIRGFVTLIR